MAFQHSQPYPMYEQRQWPEDVKSVHQDADFDQRRESHMGAAPHPGEFGTVPLSRRPSMLKVEEDLSNGDHVWQNRRHEAPMPTRHFSQPSLPTHPNSGQVYGRVDPNFLASYAQPHPGWAVSQSGTSTPTPTYAPTDAFPQPVQYAAHPAYAQMYAQDPLSAVSMSPQSSQGGWPSTASNDSPEQPAGLQSPSFRPVSPHMVMRADGIRKKNARFDIPRERNLQTIDALILASTNEDEKKELKQQKRLLRNRQAALDSRQRKKTHTEKLEQEKKVSEKRLYDLDETISNLENTIQHLMQERNNYEVALQQMQLERDEAIRQKTMETGELRKQIGALKDVIRDFERPQNRPGTFTMSSDVNGMATDFSEFNFGDPWESEFSLIDKDDLQMDEPDVMQRQATPTPPTKPTTEDDVKADGGFTKNAALMCLLIGAHVASRGSESLNADLSRAAPISSLDEYRTEAGNVLRTVLSVDPEAAKEIVPSMLQSIAGQAQNSIATPSTFDHMASTLTTPSRQQELQATFSVSASGMSQIMGGITGDDADIDLDNSPRPTRLGQALAEHQAKQRENEAAAGIINKVEQRSLLAERLTEDVLMHFRDFVKHTRSHDQMIQN